MCRLIFLAIFFATSNFTFAQTAFSVFEASISDIQRALTNGEVTSVELVEQYQARISAYDKAGPALNSIVRINPSALETAAELDRERQRTGPRSALHGVPILVKDNYNTVGMPTSGGSVALANFYPNQNATQIEKLIAAGAIVLAKTNLHEYAYGITTVGSLFGQTRNPYDLRRVPGGSSGGTGAAVAANFGAVGLGSDTCGSIRIPSAFNNLIGLRPTKGLSSIFGVMPLSHTQDVAGPLARSAEDLAIVLDVVAGFDVNDEATTLVRDAELPAFTENLTGAELAGLRLGKLQNYYGDATAVVQQPIDSALEWFEEQGSEIVDVEISQLGELLSASALITQEFKVDLNAYLEQFRSDPSNVEDIANLADIVENRLHHQAVERVLLRAEGIERDAASYAERLNARLNLKAAILQLMADHDLDAIVYPSTGQTPVQIGDPQVGGGFCSLSANSGLPALSMPVGFASNDLPVGLEILGRELADADLLAIAYRYEQANVPRQPPSVTPPLVDGRGPASEFRAVTIDEAGLQVEVLLEFDQLLNLLRYTVATAPGSSAEIAAITLAMAGEDGDEALIVHNLLAPQMFESTGTYFMSAQFREAFVDGRASLRIFADGLPAQGLLRSL